MNTVPNLPKKIFDIEIFGKKKKPKVLICIKDQGKRTGQAFWMHRKGDLDKLEKILLSGKYTWVGFNSENFDRPILAAALMGHDESAIKTLATEIIENEMKSWETYRQFSIDFFEYDHIDLFDVAPGVRISLKLYSGRMGCDVVMDMPFHYDHDLTAAEEKIVETYCLRDLANTEIMLNQLSEELKLREDMSNEYEIDLRSKSDAQIAEAILKKRVGIKNGDKTIPSYVEYTPPGFIKTKHPALLEIIDQLSNHLFSINRANGQVNSPEFLEAPLRLNNGVYQLGVGGIHSQHDMQMYLEADEDYALSDFDVASYYPNIMMKAGLIPRLGGNKGQVFLDEYRKIYEARIAAKRAGDKKVDKTLKIVLNGTFGKLGNLYCSFYSPDLMLAVTLTGQLNLLCLIAELEKIKGVECKSANTDGILMRYPRKSKDKVLKVIEANQKRTGFLYEETEYKKVAFKDVNNYFAVKLDNEVKRKGLYAESGLQQMKNPTMQVCSQLACDYLTTGEMNIKKYKDIRDYVSIRTVNGGGIQFDEYKLVDDWEQIAPRLWSYPGMRTKPVSRVSRPPAREVGVGGTPFGRVARWYMTKESLPPLSYVGTGNRVPKTEGAKLCLTLPKALPKDLDTAWYLNEAIQILSDCGLTL